MERSSDYTVTSSELAGEAGTSTPTVTVYARLGLLDYIRLKNGTRLYRAGQAGRVQEIYNQRIASRGRRKA